MQISLREAREIRKINAKESAANLDLDEEQFLKLERNPKEMTARQLAILRKTYGIPLDIIKIE